LASFAVFQIRIAARYKAMGATETVTVVGENLDPNKKADLVKILEKRKAELEKALKDVETAIGILGGTSATS
jgi:hypothetical protein